MPQLYKIMIEDFSDLEKISLTSHYELSDDIELVWQEAKRLMRGLEHCWTLIGVVQVDVGTVGTKCLSLDKKDDSL